MFEQWTIVKNCSKYSVSNYGQVKNNRNDFILKPRPDRKGYLRVSIPNNDGIIKDQLIHRLVAKAFCSGEKDGFDVNHIDGNKSNNRADNLEWCTRSHNLKHGYRIGLRSSPQNRCKSVRIIETEETFPSVRECARSLGCRHSNISLCLNGRQQSCYGYHFEWVARDDLNNDVHNEYV